MNKLEYMKNNSHKKYHQMDIILIEPTKTDYSIFKILKIISIK